MRSSSILISTLVSLALALSEARMGTAGEAGPEKADGGWLSWERATGDWGGARMTLDDHGIELGIGLTTVWQANHRGGLRSRPGGKLSTSWDIEATLDTEKLGLWPGGSFLIYLEGSKGIGLDERYVGSLFGVNGDADSTAGHRLQFSEYWYEHAFADGLLSLRLGKMDATRDFDANAFANDETAQFLNSALVNNPTVPFPDYALGAQAIVRPGGGFYVGLGTWDANAEGWTSGRDTALVSDSEWFAAAEAGVTFGIPTPAEAELPGACRIGAWHDPTRYDGLRDGESAKGRSGWYLSLDQMVHKESAEADDTQGLGLFARTGYAPGDSSEVEHFWSAGLHYQGLIPTREDDVAGIGFARGNLGAPMRREMPHDHESVVELYYSVALTGAAALTLDLQYVSHPGAAEDSSLIPGLRLQLDF